MAASAYADLYYPLLRIAIRSSVHVDTCESRVLLTNYLPSALPNLHTQVHNNKRDALSKNREHLEIVLDQSPKTLMANAQVGKYIWTMTGVNHTMRTWSSQAEPTYIFSEVDDLHPDDFYAVIFRKGAPYIR
jgi:hypothetical protein